MGPFKSLPAVTENHKWVEQEGRVAEFMAWAPGASGAGRDELLELIKEIREVFQNHFDRTWFAIIIDDLPIDFQTIRLIRELVSLHSLHAGDEHLITQGVEELESFIIHVRRYLLPYLKERLGVSWLTPARMVEDRSQYLIRRLVAYAFPHNLERLNVLTGRLRHSLSLYRPLGVS
jgi:hypothetical protein